MKKFPYFSTFFIILAALICISVGYSISTFIITTSLIDTTGVNQLQLTVYALSSKSGTEKSALLEEAKILQANGDAGYILRQDDTYYLVNNVYKNENDADLIKKTSQNESYTIVPYKIEQINLVGSFSSTEEDVLRKALNFQSSAFQTLYDISLSLDTNIYTETTAKLKINELVANFISINSSFSTLFAENRDVEITKLKNRLENFNTNLTSLMNGEFQNETQTLSSLIKFTYCNILFGALS